MSADPKVRFLLISPTEAFMPQVSSLGELSRTMLLSATGIEGNPSNPDSFLKGKSINAGVLKTAEGNPSKPDSFLKGQETWEWVNARIDRDAAGKITSSDAPGKLRDFSVGHKVIGDHINNDLLSKLIRVNLGLADRAILAEPPKAENR